jgi:hypothetical protein
MTDEQPQFEQNRAYVYVRTSNTAVLNTFLRSNGVTYQSSASIEDGVQEYEITANFDLFNNLLNQIKASDLPFILTRNKAGAFSFEASNPIDVNNDTAYANSVTRGTSGTTIILTVPAGQVFYMQSASTTVSTASAVADTPNANITAGTSILAVTYFYTPGGTSLTVSTPEQYASPLRFVAGTVISLVAAFGPPARATGSIVGYLQSV